MKVTVVRYMNFFSAARAGLFLFFLFLILPGKNIFGQEITTGSSSYSSFAIDENGNLYSWGKNQYGQLGIGTTTNDSTPVMVSFPAGVTKWLAASTGDSHTLAIGNDGNLYAWGRNNYGQLGNGTTSDTLLPAIVTKPAGVASWSSISAGTTNSYAIGDDGNLYAWGYNNFGQLGNGTKNNSNLPVKVELPTGVTAKAVSAAANSAIAIGSNDTLYAWGRNANGQLGDGTKIDNPIPAAVKLPTGVTPVMISSGAYFNSALCSDGNIYGFGSGNNGQLGNGTTTGDGTIGTGNYGTPVIANLPGGATGWKSLSDGASFVLAIANNDSLYAWGYNGTSELGIVTGLTNNPVPLNVVLPKDVIPAAVTAGHNHGFIVAKNNIIYSWGRNLEGELGLNNLINQATPANTGFILGTPSTPFLLQPAAGTAVGSHDSAFVWTTVPGAASYQFQVGSDSSLFSDVIFDTTGITDTLFIVTNNLKEKLNSDTKYFWRVTAQNKFGSGEHSSVWSFITPKSKIPNTRRLSVQSNARSSYVIGADQLLHTWGSNQYGQLGNGSTTVDSVSVIVEFPSGVTFWSKVSAGQNHAVALGSDGNLYAWGQNNYGQLGTGNITNSALPVMVSKPLGVTSWTDVAAGAFHTLAIGSDAKLYAWGYNNFGQLGDGTKTSSNLPVQITIPNGVIPSKVFATNNASLVLCSNDTLYAWGRNANGQLGDGTTTDRGTPAPVIFPVGVTNWTAVASGGYHDLAIGSDGNLYAWGSGGNGQVGVGTTGNFSTPLKVTKPAGVSNWTAVATGGNFSLALGDDGNLYGFGYDGNGELGIDTAAATFSNPEKVIMPAGVTRWTAVAAGWNHSIALDDRDSIYTWGLNSSGQLGNNSTVKSLVPVQIHFFYEAVPSVPVLTGPVNGDTLGTTDTSLVWIAAAGADSYRIQISTDSLSFSPAIFDSTGVADTLISLSNLVKTKLTSATKYFWRVNASNNNGTSAYSTVWSFVTPLPTGVASDANILPKVYALNQNYPNPFNPSTIISYEIPKNGFVTLKVYNILGQIVTTLYEGIQKPGSYRINFNASNLASGVYLYRLQSEGYTKTMKMLLMK